MPVRPRRTIGRLTEHAHHDGHGHPHDHGHEHDTGPLAYLKSLVAPHSHDAADSIDSSLESSEEGIRAVKVSLAGLGATAVLQAVVVLLTGSVALLGDTLHNFADALTALPLWLAFTVGRRRPTARYTYGYGRGEDLAGIFIVVMIAGSAVLAAYESVRRLVEPEPVRYLGALVVASLLGFAGNELVASYRIRVGRRIGSAALVADGLHARTDGLTSLAVLLGAIGVWLGWDRADPVAGLLITVAILFVLKDAVREVWWRLMDAVDPELVERARATVGETEGVEEVREVRVRWIGHRLRAEVRIAVTPSLSIVDAHDIAEHASHHLLHEMPKLADAMVHVDPAGDGHHDRTAHHRETHEETT